MSTDQQSIQSFHEPALNVLNKLHKRNCISLRNKGYDENNAAVSREELTQKLAHQFRITQWIAGQVVTSMINANLALSFGGYIKPKVVVSE